MSRPKKSRRRITTILQGSNNNMLKRMRKLLGFADNNRSTDNSVGRSVPRVPNITKKGSKRRY